ncbi:hypothetical protein HII31_08844, partial [Pseudocercospora fuligena]
MNNGSQSSSSSEADWQSEKDNILPDTKHIPFPSHRPSNRSIILIIFSIITTNLLTNILTYYLTKTSTLSLYSQDLPSSKPSSSPILPPSSTNLFPFSLENLPSPHPHPPINSLQQPPLNHTSIYSAPPSPAVDRAWNELGVKDQIFLLPDSLGREIGLDPRKHVLAPENSLGEGVGAGFGVFVQGLHDMHCLNELRRALYFNKPCYREYENDELTPEWSRQSHIRHCLDNIRERIQCSADTGVIPTVWVNEEENYPLFGWQEHKCQSYEALMEWFRNWHESDEAKKIDWTTKLKAPSDVIFTDFGRLEQ